MNKRIKQIIKESSLLKLLRLLSCAYVKVCNPTLNIVTNYDALLQSVKITKSGGGNSITLGRQVRLTNCTFHFHGRHNSVIIGDNAILSSMTFWIEDDNNVIVVGARTSSYGNVQLAACEGCCIEIGEDCMFSHDIYVRTTDSHSITDADTDERTNFAENIKIGNHVWIGMQSLILKGSVVGDNSIVAARSTVSRTTPNQDNVIISGAPGKIIKQRVNWRAERF